MDIGSKIKNARVDANLTQEQAAEALGVSRQTISNWENDKTYPDIISVIKMSDLYHVSLDHLLKEEASMSNYLDYLEESTNTVKSSNKMTAIIIVVSYLVIWAFSLITFWFFISGSDAMAYSLIFLWIVLPVTTFILSVLIGKNNGFGNWKWLSSIMFGIMYMLAEYATFIVANTMSPNIPRFERLIAGVIISLFGIGIGAVVNFFQHRTKRRL